MLYAALEIWQRSADNQMIVIDTEHMQCIEVDDYMKARRYIDRLKENRYCRLPNTFDGDVDEYEVLRTFHQEVPMHREIEKRQQEARKKEREKRQRRLQAIRTILAGQDAGEPVRGKAARSTSHQ